MDEAVPVSRREPLTRLRIFSSAVREHLQAGGFSPDQIFAIFDSSITAECTQCRIQVSGKELFEVGSDPVVGQHAGPKIARMRLGDCARQGCDSMYYNLTLQPYPRVDWPAIIAQAATREFEESGVVTVKSARSRLPRIHITPKTARTMAVAVGAVLVLFVARQYYYGGRIPLLREPEHFRVDQASPGATSAQTPEYLRE